MVIFVLYQIEYTLQKGETYDFSKRFKNRLDA